MNFTGSNTKMGSLITFKVKGANANFALGIERVFITAVSEQIFELSESASTVLDENTPSLKSLKPKLI